MRNSGKAKYALLLYITETSRHAYRPHRIIAIQLLLTTFPTFGRYMPSSSVSNEFFFPIECYHPELGDALGRLKD